MYAAATTALRTLCIKCLFRDRPVLHCKYDTAWIVDCTLARVRVGTRLNSTNIEIVETCSICTRKIVSIRCVYNGYSIINICVCARVIRFGPNLNDNSNNIMRWIYVMNSSMRRFARLCTTSSWSYRSDDVGDRTETNYSSNTCIVYDRSGII